MSKLFGFGKFLLVLEICFVIFWFITSINNIYSFSTHDSESYRLVGGFLGIHPLITPAAILFVIENSEKPPVLAVVWLFIGSLFYDLVSLMDVSVHLSKEIIPVAWNIQYASSIWLVCLSGLTLAWYICILKTNAKTTKKTFF